MDAYLRYPEPISVTLEVGVGDIRIVASDRTDTIVDVRPSDPAKKSDVTAAELTRVEYAHGRLLVEAPKGWRQWSFRGGGESIGWRSSCRRDRTWEARQGWRR